MISETTFENCRLGADSPMWESARLVVSREIVRAGKDSDPEATAAQLIRAMRAGGYLHGYARLVNGGYEVEPCTMRWNALACFAWWFATRSVQDRSAALATLAKGMSPVTAGALASCVGVSPVPGTCCPSFVYDDPAYMPAPGAIVPVSSSIPKPAGHTHIATWLISLAALGTFGLALFSTMRKKKRAG